MIEIGPGPAEEESSVSVELARAYTHERQLKGDPSMVSEASFTTSEEAPRALEVKREQGGLALI